MGDPIIRSRYFTNPYEENASEEAASVTVEWLKKEANKLVHKIMNRGPNEDDLDGGVYVGIGGDGYGAFYARKLMPEKRDAFLDFAVDSVTAQMKANKDRSPENMSRYLIGPLGLMVIKEIFSRETGTGNSQGITKIFSSLLPFVLTSGYQKHGDDEMIVGRAGFLAAVLTLRQYANVDVLSNADIASLVKKMIESGRDYANKITCEPPLMYQYYGTEYLGAAHGLMGILQMMLSFPNALDEAALTDVKSTLDWILSIQQENGNIATALEEVLVDRGPDELVHWCHGATGAVHLFIVAYIRLKDDRFLEAAKKCLDLIWNRGVLQKGPGICHGVAGSGYANLLFYRLTKDEQYLDRAKCFAKVFCTDEFKRRARTPDSPYSLFEGIAGSLCYLCDLADPENAQFPLIPIPFPDS